MLSPRLFFLLVALLAATALSAPANPYPLQTQQSPLRASALALQAPGRCLSWLSKLLSTRDDTMRRMACFCAGGSLCCRDDALGQLDCNRGFCGI